MHICKFCFSLLAAVVVWLAPQSAIAAGASRAPTTVLFVGGYASTLARAAQSFAPLRTALQAHSADLNFAQYSYTGWNGDTCTPLDYQPTDTAQDLERSERVLLETIYTLQQRCGADRIVIIGHSLGGLIALQALADNPMRGVADIVTIDSPLGGTPLAGIAACGDSGVCVDGPLNRVLSGLYANWDQTAVDNRTRVSQLAGNGVRVTAWGNEKDCLYAPDVCLPFASNALRAYDATETQWLGIDRARRRNYASRSTLQAVLGSHEAVLSAAADDIAAELTA